MSQHPRSGYLDFRNKVPEMTLNKPSPARTKELRMAKSPAGCDVCNPALRRHRKTLLSPNLVWSTQSILIQPGLYTPLPQPPPPSYSKLCCCNIPREHQRASSTCKLRLTLKGTLVKVFLATPWKTSCLDPSKHCGVSFASIKGCRTHPRRNFELYLLCKVNENS